MPRNLRDTVQRTPKPRRRTGDKHTPTRARAAAAPSPAPAASSSSPEETPEWRQPLRTYMRDAPHGRARCWFFVGERTKTRVKRVIATLDLKSRSGGSEEWVFITASQEGRRLIGWVSTPKMKKLLERASKRRRLGSGWKKRLRAFSREVKVARRARSYDGNNWKSFISRKAGKRLDGSGEAKLVKRGRATGNAHLRRSGAARGSYEDQRVVVGAPVGRVANRKFWVAEVRPGSSAFMYSVVPPTDAEDEKVCPKEIEKGKKAIKLVRGDERGKPTDFGAITRTRRVKTGDGKKVPVPVPRQVMLGTIQLTRKAYEKLEKSGDPAEAAKVLYRRGDYVWTFLPSHGAGWMLFENMTLKPDGFREGPAPQGSKKSAKKGSKKSAKKGSKKSAKKGSKKSAKGKKGSKGKK